MDLDGAVTELYAQHPDAFTGARTALVAQVRADGDPGLARAVAGVRKPTVAAWAVNRLVRQRPDELAALLDLARRLQDASERMDGAALRDLGRERTTLVDTLLRATRDVAADEGGPLTGTVLEQVRETVVAALASPPAADAVASGRLTRALSYAGFGDVDLSQAIAAPPPVRRPALTVLQGEGRGRADQPDQPDQPEPAEPVLPGRPDPALVERRDAARRRTRETTALAAAAGSLLEEATTALTDLDARVGELEAALAAARTQRDGLLTARAEAAAADKAAQRTLRASFAELDAAQDLLGETDD